MERYSVMTVGESQTGKTSLSICFRYKKFPSEYLPSILEVFSKDLTVHGTTCYVTVYEDAPHDEKCDRMRRMSYPEINTFIALYSVDSRQSFERLKNKWIPELQAFEPKTPILIVANKIELRGKSGCDTVSFNEGFCMAKELGTSYREISCKDLWAIEECYEHAIELAMLNTPKVKEILNMSSVLIPPLVPPRDPEPVIERAPSTFAKDLLQFVNSQKYHDVRFILEGEKRFYSHRIFLCSVSSFFRKIFLTSIASHPQTETIDCFNIDDLNLGKIPGIKRVYEEGTVVTVELTCDIKADTFSKALTFIYSGSIPQNLADLELSELSHLAQTFEIPGLVLQCNKAVSGEDNTDNGKGPAISEFFKQDLFSDIVFNVKGTKIPGHKVVVCARSKFLAQKVDEMCHVYPGIKVPAHKMVIRDKQPWEKPSANPYKEEEDPRIEIPIYDHSVEVFTAFLEYAYTDHVHFDDSIDACAFSYLAGHMYNYDASRLAEVQMRKDVEVMIEKLGKGQHLDAIGLLQKYKACWAYQMMSWDYHYIGTNYNKFEQNLKTEKFGLAFKTIKHHRWPPVHYLQEVEDFEKNLKKTNLFCIWQK